MSYSLIEKKDNKAKIEIVVEAATFEKYVNDAYKKNRGRFNIQGFRKGKAPRKMIESMYGEGVFYEEALNLLLPIEYEKAVEELELDTVDRPDIDVEEIGKGIDLKITAEVAIKPEVTLGDYKGIEVKKPETEVSDEDVEKELKEMQEKSARIVVAEDRPAADGDILIIDFEGFLGEEAFEGGQASNHELTLGSGQFIPGFEEQLIGKNAGDEVTVTVTFPEDYHAENLAGQEARFEVKIHEIKMKELPALDDDFAVDTSEFETLAELKASIKERLVEANEKSAESYIRDQVIEKAAEAASLDVPEPMVETEVDQMLREFEYSLSYQGINLEQYAQFTGSSVDELKEQMKEEAKKRVETSLTLEKIGEVEEIEVTEEDIEAELQKFADAQKSSLEETRKIFEADNFEYLKNTIRTRKTVDFLVENAKITE